MIIPDPFVPLSSAVACDVAPSATRRLLVQTVGRLTTVGLGAALVAAVSGKFY